MNLLNPNPYLGWALVLGPVVVAAWQETPSMGVAVVVAFYATLVSMLAILIFLFGGALVFVLVMIWMNVNTHAQNTEMARK